MSRSVSAPSSVTNTSPCWNGFIVPGSTLRYGSSFCIVTRRPRERSRRPRLEAVRPLPSEEATPPVTNTCLVGCDPAASFTGLHPIPGRGRSLLYRVLPRRSGLRGSVPRSRDLEQFPRVCQGRVGVREAGQHPAQLALPAL